MSSSADNGEIPEHRLDLIKESFDRLLFFSEAFLGSVRLLGRVGNGRWAGTEVLLRKRLVEFYPIPSKRS